MLRLHRQGELPFAVLKVEVAVNHIDLENLVVYWLRHEEELPQSRIEFSARIKEDAEHFVTDALKDQGRAELYDVARAYVQSFFPKWYEI